MEEWYNELPLYLKTSSPNEPDWLALVRNRYTSGSIFVVDGGTTQVI